MVAPSTLGTFLRAFTFGHVRQLDRVLGETLQRAWAAGAGPGAGRLVIDVDSFVGEVHRHAKQGAAFGYTRVRGYHPMLATRADTGEVLHIRLRKGSANTSARVVRFIDELIARVAAPARRGRGCCGPTSGFWNKQDLRRAWTEAGWQYSIGVRLQARVRAAIEQISEDAWTDAARLPRDRDRADRRDHARRPSDWSSAASAPSIAQDSCLPELGALPVHDEPRRADRDVEAEHRQHAVVELAIRDLKDQALAHFPSGHFYANAAWTVIACLAHNLLRWTSCSASPARPSAPPARPPPAARAPRPPDPHARAAGHCTCPPAGPGRHDFTEALARIRALPTAA